MEDLTGQVFGKLTVLGYGYTMKEHRYWLCKCECGNERFASTKLLKNGRIYACHSCGKIFKPSNQTEHDRQRVKLYKVWGGMLDRINNPNHRSYHRYGGRGIKVCDDWGNKQTGFLAFYEWATNNGYADGLTIDREDNDGNYEPSNCRWVTQKIQSNNMSTNHNITLGNETKSLCDWCRIFNLDYDSVQVRISKLKWTEIDALTTKTNKKFTEYNVKEEKRWNTKLYSIR
jgi:hypothetical protein